MNTVGSLIQVILSRAFRGALVCTETELARREAHDLSEPEELDTDAIAELQGGRR